MYYYTENVTKKILDSKTQKSNLTQHHQNSKLIAI